MDFRRAFELVTRDPDWLRKLIFAGLPVLIPLVGWIALLGWQRRVFDNVRQGQEVLPDPSLMEDIKYGIDPLIALLNPMPVMLLVMFVGFGLPAIGMAVLGSMGGGDAAQVLGLVFGLVQIVGGLVWLVTIIAFQVILPELIRRGFRGERFPLLSLGVSVAAIRANLSPYVMLIIGSFVANLVGGLGIYLCCVGFFLTQPAAMAFLAHLTAQWDQKVG